MFHICDTVTTPEVRIRRVIVWRSLESTEVEATTCMGEQLGTSEMFREDFTNQTRGTKGLELVLAKR